MSVCRGMVDESGDQFVAYFLPTPETLEKRRHDAEIEVDYGRTRSKSFVALRCLFNLELV